MRSVAPPQMASTGVDALCKALRLWAYMSSIRLSSRAGGRECGVDIVIMAEMSGDGRRERATIPPMEWPMRMICVWGGYKERMYRIAEDVYARSESSVGPWSAEKSSLKSTVRGQDSVSRDGYDVG